MLRLIEAGEFLVAADSEAHDVVEQFGETERDDAGVGDDRHDGDDLADDKAPISEEQTVDTTHAGVGEEAEQHATDDATDHVDADDVEAVVVTELRLELDGEVAADRSDEAEDDRRKTADETGCRGDGDETGDDTRGPAERRGVACARRP